VSEADVFVPILTQEGFSSVPAETPSRTILMDITPTLEELRGGMRPHWSRELKRAERQKLEIVEGTSDELFATFITIYKDMVFRKKFAEANDINQFRRIQARLPESLKMKIMLCKSGDDVCAGLVCSLIGKAAVYIFGATSTSGMKSNGSYLLQWRLIESLKRSGCSLYNLNGINPLRNPGTYKFKNDLAGKHGNDVCFLGRFDSYSGGVSYSLVKYAETLQAMYRAAKHFSIAGWLPHPKDAR
jgi:lipid II:glycine glycyltransferase (peptidoglycan interpeptide bridge formation enzyme)